MADILKLECSRVLRSDDSFDGSIIELFSNETYDEFCVRLVNEDQPLFHYTEYANEAIDLYFHTTLHYSTFSTHDAISAWIAA